MFSFSMTALFPIVRLFLNYCRAYSSVASHDHFDQEVILNSFDADWTAFCSEVNRVMSGGGFAFEFKMSYMYSYHTDMNLDNYTNLLDKRYQSVIAKLPIKNSVHWRIILGSFSFHHRSISCSRVWNLLYLDDGFFGRYSYTNPIFVPLLTKCVKKH